MSENKPKLEGAMKAAGVAEETQKSGWRPSAENMGEGKTPAKTSVVLSPEGMEAILTKADDPAVKTVFDLMCMTGLRRDEISKLKVKNLASHKKHLRAPSMNGKRIQAALSASGGQGPFLMSTLRHSYFRNYFRNYFRHEDREMTNFYLHGMDKKHDSPCDDGCDKEKD